MTKNIRFLLTLLTFAWAATLRAYYYNNVRVNDTPVRCMAQTDNGLLWLGTGNGLYCYDGYRAIPKRGSSDEMRATIYCMMANGSRIYVGTTNGFYIYDTATGAYSEPQLLGQEVRALEKSGQKILLGCHDGLKEYDPASRTIKTINNELRDIYSITCVEGTIYLGTLKGLFAYSDGKPTHITLNERETSSVFVLLADRLRQCLWAGAGEMLYKYDMANGRVTKMTSLEDVSVKAMSLSDDHTLYVATDNGLYTYADKLLSHDKHDSQNPHSIADNVVWSTLIDGLGNIVLGTDIGVSVIPAKYYYEYMPIGRLTGEKEGNKLSEILVDSKGRKWLGGSNGLILSEKGNSRWYRQADKRNPISHNRIREVYEDLTGNIWIATDNGINLYDEPTGRMRTIIITDKNNEVNARWAYDIIDDGFGRLWVAAFDGGIFIVSKKKLTGCGEFVVADNIISFNRGSKKNVWVRQLAKDENGHVWARTAERLERIDIASLKVTTVSKTPPGRMAADRHGNIWTANTNELLCYAASGSVRSFPYSVKNEDVEAVALCDINGNMWVVTSDECIILSDAENHRYSRLRIPIVNAYGAFYSPSGRRFFIGGQDGMVAINPSGIDSRIKRKELLLSAFRINGELRHVNGREITLQHNENNIDLCFSDLPYSGDVSLSYAYMLKGIDNRWHLMRSIEEPLVYRALPHGRYTLTIRSIESNLENGKEVFHADIEILPPWYLSWWAKTLYVMLFVVTGVWLARFWIMRKQLAKEKREKQLFLEQSRARMDFYNNVSRNLRHSLHKIMSLSAENNGKATADCNRTISAVRSQTTQMNTLIRQAFDMGNIAEERQHLEQSRVNAVRFCKETMEGIRLQADEKGINFIFQSDKEEIMIETEVLKFDVIISILLQNIINNTRPESTITVALKHDEELRKVMFSFNCNTLDLPENVKPHLFQYYVQPKDLPVEVISMVSELAQAKTYIDELGGKLAVETATEGGTDFVMTFNTMAVEVKHTLDTSVGNVEKPSAEMNERDEKLLREITIAIERNLIDSDFNVARLQETMGLGQKLLYRKIKQLSGVSPVEYIRNIRMEKAGLLLREGKFSISEVMYMVGFTKSGYFSKCFQNAYGMTPSAYIKHTNQSKQ